MVKAAGFQENKKILQNRKYKDTEEFQLHQEYHKLLNSPAIQVYYEVLESEQLKHYIKFKSTPDYELLGDKKKLKASESLQKMKAFEKSKAFKTYSRFHDSFIIKEYEQLKVKVATPEFKKTNEFWANKNRTLQLNLFFKNVSTNWQKIRI